MLIWRWTIQINVLFTFLKFTFTEHVTQIMPCILKYSFLHLGPIHHILFRTLAVKCLAMLLQTYNLGTGEGVSVLQLVQAFERNTSTKVTLEMLPRREGDIVSMYANTDLASKELQWRAKYSLDEMCKLLTKGLVYLFCWAPCIGRRVPVHWQTSACNFQIEFSIRKFGWYEFSLSWCQSFPMHQQTVPILK